MRFMSLSPGLSLYSFLLVAIISDFSLADESQSLDPGLISVKSQTTYDGSCTKLLLAGEDLTSSCGTSLVVIGMTNGSVSITIQQFNSDLGLFGSEINQDHYSIHGAFVHGTDNIPLQGNCELITSMDDASNIMCHMTDNQGNPWEIQFNSSH